VYPDGVTPAAHEVCASIHFMMSNAGRCDPTTTVVSITVELDALAICGEPGSALWQFVVDHERSAF
jgi:hypothetical protein